MNKTKYIGDSSLCDCKTVYSIEEHGDSYAIYYGRCNHRHGMNLGRLKESSQPFRNLLEYALNKVNETN